MKSVLKDSSVLLNGTDFSRPLITLRKKKQDNYSKNTENFFLLNAPFSPYQRVPSTRNIKEKKGKKCLKKSPNKGLGIPWQFPNWLFGQRYRTRSPPIVKRLLGFSLRGGVFPNWRSFVHQMALVDAVCLPLPSNQWQLTQNR
ncbi:hypothetical protein CDAR_51461 [Caerostris darwini]|uniref:Uncharacterized protein n=1 Tax=Caerostris darwini TaxID=1538125 RepID=A0AAV4U6G9_9ARAC|nr:hypothetical protein CDAR_51461 [Caerostris darwini]